MNTDAEIQLANGVRGALIEVNAARSARRKATLILRDLPAALDASVKLVDLGQYKRSLPLD
jgi:hypothetical protein